MESIFNTQKNANVLKLVQDEIIRKYPILKEAAVGSRLKVTSNPTNKCPSPSALDSVTENKDDDQNDHFRDSIPASTPEVLFEGPKIERKLPFYFNEKLDIYATPSFGSENNLVPFTFQQTIIAQAIDQAKKASRIYKANQRVNNSLIEEQKSLSEQDKDPIISLRIPQYIPYLTSRNNYDIAKLAYNTSMLNSLASYSLGRSLIRSLPEAFADWVIHRSKPMPNDLLTSTFELIIVAKGFVDADDCEEEEEEIVEGEDRSSGDSKTLILSEEELEKEARILQKEEEAGLGVNSGTASTTEIPKAVKARVVRAKGSGKKKIILPREAVSETSTTSLPCSKLFWGGASSCVTYIPPSAASAVDDTIFGKKAYEKMIRIRGPEPYYVTTTIVIARLAHLYLNLKSLLSELTEELSKGNRKASSMDSQRDSTTSTSSEISDDAGQPKSERTEGDIEAGTGSNAVLPGNAGVENIEELRKCISLPTGGVFTPSVLFRDVPEVYNLLANSGIDFTVLDPHCQ
jgi:hypothetical protein